MRAAGRWSPRRSPPSGPRRPRRPAARPGRARPHLHRRRRRRAVLPRLPPDLGPARVRRRALPVAERDRRHGRPSGRRLADGDLLSVDCGAIVDGWHGDGAAPSTSDAGGRRRAAARGDRAALAAGIAAAVPGATLRDVAVAIDAVARTHGYEHVLDHGGHGIGRQMHQGPSIANVPTEGPAGSRAPGHTVALEPISSRRRPLQAQRDLGRGHRRRLRAATPSTDRRHRRGRAAVDRPVRTAAARPGRSAATPPRARSAPPAQSRAVTAARCRPRRSGCRRRRRAPRPSARRGPCS